MNNISSFLNPANLATTSLIIAHVFNKKHSDVLSVIDNIQCSESFSNSNFKPFFNDDPVDGCDRYIELTQDGFIFFLFGFYGPNARQLRVGIRKTFDGMVSNPRLARPQNPLPQLSERDMDKVAHWRARKFDCDQRLFKLGVPIDVPALVTLDDLLHAFVTEKDSDECKSERQNLAEMLGGSR